MTNFTKSNTRDAFGVKILNNYYHDKISFTYFKLRKAKRISYIIYCLRFP